MYKDFNLYVFKSTSVATKSQQRLLKSIEQSTKEYIQPLPQLSCIKKRFEWNTMFNCLGTMSLGLGVFLVYYDIDRYNLSLYDVLTLIIASISLSVGSSILIGIQGHEYVNRRSRLRSIDAPEELMVTEQPLNAHIDGMPRVESPFIQDDERLRRMNSDPYVGSDAEHVDEQLPHTAVDI